MFESGVSRYIKSTAMVEVFFPVDQKGNPFICCGVCRFYWPTSKRCALTEEVIPWPDKYVGRGCPLEEVKDGEHL